MEPIQCFNCPANGLAEHPQLGSQGWELARPGKVKKTQDGVGVPSLLRHTIVIACGPSLSVALSHRPKGALTTAQSPERPYVLSFVLSLNFLRAKKLSLVLAYFNSHMSSQGSQIYWQEQCQVNGCPGCHLGAQNLWGDEAHHKKPGYRPGP